MYTFKSRKRVSIVNKEKRLGINILGEERTTVDTWCPNTGDERVYVYVCVFMGQFLVNAVADQWQDPWACSTGGQCPEEGKEGGFTIRDTVVGSSEPLDSIFFCQLISI